VRNFRRGHLVVVVTFITFNILFDKTLSGSFYQNYVAAILGSAIVIIVTWILLSQQTRHEEIRESNVEVFRRKVEKLEAVTSLLLKCLEDGHIDDEEARLLHNAMHEMALFCSDETLEALARFLRQEIIGDIAEAERTQLIELIMTFRSELRLGPSRLDKEQIRVLSTALTDLARERDALAARKRALDMFADQLGKTLEKQEVDGEMTLPSGVGNRCEFQFFVTDKVEGRCFIPYGSPDGDAAHCRVEFTTEPLCILRSKNQKRVAAALVGVGFAHNPDYGEDEHEEFCLDLRLPIGSADEHTTSVRETARKLAVRLADGLAAIEATLNEAPKPE